MLTAQAAARTLLIIVLVRADAAREIEDLVEHEAVRRRGGPGALAIAAREQRRQRVLRAAAVADLDQRADDVAHHVLEKGSRFDNQIDLRSVLQKFESAHRANGGPR